MRLNKNNNQIQQVIPAAKLKGHLGKREASTEDLQMLRICEKAVAYISRSITYRERLTVLFEDCIAILGRLNGPGAEIAIKRRSMPRPRKHLNSHSSNCAKTGEIRENSRPLCQPDQKDNQTSVCDPLVSQF